MKGPGLLIWKLVLGPGNLTEKDKLLFFNVWELNLNQCFKMQPKGELQGIEEAKRRKPGQTLFWGIPQKEKV